MKEEPKHLGSNPPDQSIKSPASVAALGRALTARPFSANGTSGKIIAGTEATFRIAFVENLCASLPNIATVTHRGIILGIRDGRWAEGVLRVREAMLHEGKGGANREKRKLPAVLPSGVFNKRSNQGLLERTGLICADLDDLGDQLPSYREYIEADEHTLACFLSPTGTGLKVWLRLDLERTHEEGFRAMRRHFLERFELEIDEACKDVSRACFVSYDPEAHLAKDAQVLPYPPEPVRFDAPEEKMPAARLIEGTRPGDDYDARGDFFGLLQKHGWMAIGGVGKRWTRPGKTHGVSATWDEVPGRFYVFSSNAEPLEWNKAYKPWHVFALLEHGGDFKAAGRALAAQGYGEQRTRTVDAAALVPALTVTSWPDPVAASYLFASPPSRPPELISGMLYHGGTMLMAGASKSRKTYTLLQQGVAVATGGTWLGMKCDLAPVLYLNFELQDFAVHDRLRSICDALRIKPPENLHLWNLRGVKCSAVGLGQKVPDMIRRLGAKLVILDPYYKVSSQSGKDEISNHEQGELLCALETMCAGPGAALTIAHHFAKGNQSAKNAIDRASGGGVFARWPDVMITMTDHKEEDALTVEMALRNFAPKKPFVMRFEYPLWLLAPELKANELKDAGGRKKEYEEEDTLAK